MRRPEEGNTRGPGFRKRSSLAQARDRLLALARRLPAESASPEQAVGRVTAAAVHSVIASPHYRASAMDGIAVRARDTLQASMQTPVLLARLEQGAPANADRPGCIEVDTGNALPEWSDAVIRIEDVRRVGDGFEITQPVAPGRDVRRIGEDVGAGVRLLARGHLVTPYDVGSMVAGGVASLEVVARPRVAILATGSEIIEPGTPPSAGQIIEFNSRVLAALARQWGASPRYLGCLKDDRNALENALRSAASNHDVVCIIAGSSAGSKDVTAAALAGCGELFVHGIDLMPGRPATCAVIGDTPVIGIPGYPVSAMVIYRELLHPLLAAQLGTRPVGPATCNAQVRRKIPSRLGAEELLRVCIRWNGGDLIAVPLARGAGATFSMVQADGLLRIAPECEGIEAGARVSVELLHAGVEPVYNVVVAGSPDPLTAALEDASRGEQPSAAAPTWTRVVYLGRADVDALQALRDGEADVVVLCAGSKEPTEDAPDASVGRVLARFDIGDGRSVRLVARDEFARSAAGEAWKELMERPETVAAAAAVKRQDDDPAAASAQART